MGRSTEINISLKRGKHEGSPYKKCETDTMILQRQPKSAVDAAAGYDGEPIRSVTRVGAVTSNEELNTILNNMAAKICLENQTQCSVSLLIPILQSVIGCSGFIEITQTLFQRAINNGFDVGMLTKKISLRRQTTDACFVVVTVEDLTSEVNTRMLLMLANEPFMKLNGLKLICLTNSKEISFPYLKKQHIVRTSGIVKLGHVNSSSSSNKYLIPPTFVIFTGVNANYKPQMQTILHKISNHFAANKLSSPFKKTSFLSYVSLMCVRTALKIMSKDTCPNLNNSDNLLIKLSAILYHININLGETTWYDLADNASNLLSNLARSCVKQDSFVQI